MKTNNFTNHLPNLTYRVIGTREMNDPIAAEYSIYIYIYIYFSFEVKYRFCSISIPHSMHIVTNQF
jgi:hypothetical protein